MSQYEDDSQTQQEPIDERETMKDLRSAADEGRKAKRELAFVKAGIDTDTPLGAMFATAYGGDLTREAIAEEWEKIAPPAVDQAPPPQPEVPANEEIVDQRAAQDRARRAISSTPAEPVQEPTIDPLKRGYDQFHQNLRDGLDRERAAKPVFEEIIGAAVAGDQRFIFDGWTDEELRDGKVSRA